MALLRIMMCDDGNGLLKIGEKSYQLGVRPNRNNKYHDMSVSLPDELVRPEQGEGISFTAMPREKFRNSDFAIKSLSFSSDRAIWEIEIDALPTGLTARPTTN